MADDRIWPASHMALERRHCEPPVSSPIPHTDLEQVPVHGKRSAAIHASASHGLLHLVRYDGSAYPRKLS